MKIVGITGSIGSGKSFICEFLKAKNYKVFEADEAVKQILKMPFVIKKLQEFFPECFDDDKLDKKKLATIVFNDKEKLNLLESVNHPLVINKRDDFIRANKNEKVVFIEAPLLYERGYDLICDKVIVVSISEHIRFARIKDREGMSEDKLDNILQNQIIDRDKKIVADFIIDNSNSNENTIEQIEEILTKLRVQ